MSSDLDVKIDRWEPAGPGLVDDGLVAYIRAIVRAAAPRRWVEARNALKWGLAYLQWALTPGIRRDARDLFAASRIDDYATTTLTGPQGTRDAMASILKRLHPDIGFAGTTRTTPVRPAAPSRKVPPAATVVRGPDRPMPADVEAAIDDYLPTLIDPGDWATVATFVRDVVRTARPMTVQRARHLCRDTAYLAVWARSDHRVIAVDTTLSAGTIETFLTALVRNGLPARSVASYAANLHLLREMHGLPLDVPRRTFPAPETKGPYLQTEIDLQFERAARIEHPGRRRHVQAALHLLFGVGAWGTEIGFVEPDHITVTDGTVTVALGNPARHVVALDRHAAGLAAAKDAAVKAGDRYLIGGNGPVRKNRLAQILGARAGDPAHVQVDTTRTRATWLVESAATPGRYPTLVDHLRSTGLTTLVRLDELLGHIVERHRELTTLPTAPLELIIHRGEHSDAQAAEVA